MRKKVEVVIKFAGAVPRCATRVEYAEWLIAAKHALVDPEGFCADCLPAHATIMRAMGKCEHPEIEFRKIDGGWRGVLPEQKDDE